MRIIAGALKGRRLTAPDWGGLRPTSDKLRETLFNILAARIEGARVLDAYAGTGAVGIEAFSRGAREVTFIESDRRAHRLIADNLAHCGIASSYTVMRQDVGRALRSLAFSRPVERKPHRAARGPAWRWKSRCMRAPRLQCASSSDGS